MASDSEDDVPLAQQSSKTLQVPEKSSKRKHRSYIPPGYTVPKTAEKRESKIPSNAEWNTNAIQSKKIKEKLAPTEHVKHTVKAGKRVSNPLIKVENEEPKNPLLQDRSSKRVSWIPPATVIKRDVEKGNATILLQTKRADGESESHFVGVRTLAIIRLVFVMLSLGYVGWYLWDQQEYFFNQLLGWHWLGLLSYFTMAFFKSYRHVTAAQDSFFSLDTPLFDILYISVTSFSLFMVGFYWILLRPTNLRMIGQWAPHQFQTLVGYHLGLFMTIPEIFLTCHPIIKIQAIFPPFAAVAYIFLVWITHYFGNWPWPLPIFPEYFEKELHFMFLAASFAVLLLSMTFACTVVYSLVQLRELISEKRLGVKEYTYHSCGGSIIALDIRQGRGEGDTYVMRQITPNNDGIVYTPPSKRDAFHTVRLPCGSIIKLTAHFTKKDRWIDASLHIAGRYEGYGGICNQ